MHQTSQPPSHRGLDPALTKHQQHSDIRPLRVTLKCKRARASFELQTHLSPQGTVFHTLPKPASPRSLPRAFPPPPSPKSLPFIRGFPPWVVFTCVLTQPCRLCTPKAAEAKRGWLRMSKGWLKHVLSPSHGQECELRPLAVAYKKIEVGFGLSPRCHSRVVVVATSVSDPAVQGPKTSSHGSWRVSPGRAQSCWTKRCGKQGEKSLGLHKVRGSEKRWGWLWHEGNVLGAASASCHARGACETQDGKSFLCFPGEVTSTRMSYSSPIVRRACRAWPVAERETRLWDEPAGASLSPPLLCHSSPPPRWPGCAHAP